MAELTLDKSRMDFIERVGARLTHDYKRGPQPWSCSYQGAWPDRVIYHGKTAREAIDAAIRQHHRPKPYECHPKGKE